MKALGLWLQAGLDYLRSPDKTPKDRGSGSQMSESLVVLPSYEQATFRIGVISDTHIPDRLKELPSAVFAVFSQVNLIVHAGDISVPAVLDELNSIAPTLAVAGNNRGDSSNFDNILPKQRLILIGNSKIGLIHGETSNLGLRVIEWVFSSILYQGWLTNRMILHRIRPRFTAAECVIFGHSHTPYIGWHNNILYFNPGSPVNRVGRQSVGILEVSKTGLTATINRFG